MDGQQRTPLSAVEATRTVMLAGMELSIWCRAVPDFILWSSAQQLLALTMLADTRLVH